MEMSPPASALKSKARDLNLSPSRQQPQEASPEHDHLGTRSWARARSPVSSPTAKVFMDGRLMTFMSSMRQSGPTAFLGFYGKILLIMPCGVLQIESHAPKKIPYLHFD